MNYRESQIFFAEEAIKSARKTLLSEEVEFTTAIHIRCAVEKLTDAMMHLANLEKKKP